ncbi:MAG: helix-turn-helix domain-containing protein [Bacteroidales bacterium]|nr:helix-turn-helix domain-containing protein [Bacteroidales bacterium]
MKKQIILLISNLLAAIPIAGQSISGIPFTEKIQGRRIMQCIEDSDGYLWIGTDKGLFRYNGSVNIPYYADGPESLTSDFIVSLCADTNQRIWVGTDNGICLIQNGKVVRQSEPAGEYAFSLFNLNDSTLLYSSQDALFQYDKDSGKSTIVLQGDDYSTPRGYILFDDRIWINAGFSNESMLTIYSSDFKKLRDVPIKDIGTTTGMAAKGDTVFIAGSRGIRCFLPDGEAIPVPPELQAIGDREIALCSDNPHFNSIIFGVRNEGIWLYRPGRPLFKVNQGGTTLPANFYRVIPAKETLVLSEWEKDLLFLFGPTGTFRIPGVKWGEVLTNILPGDAPGQSFLVTTGNLYGFDTGTLDCQALPLSFLRPAGQKIRSSVRSSTGDIILMDRQGQLIRLSKTGEQWAVSSRQNTSFPDGWIWEDYEGHICTVHEDTLYWTGSDGQSGSSPLGMKVEGLPYKSADGRLYLVGSRGIFQLDFGHRFNRLPIDVPYASCLLRTAEGDLFIGSATDGLFQYHPADQSLTHFGREEGLPERAVSNLAQDSEGNIWISTKHYISRLDKAEKSITVKDFSSTFPLNYTKLCVLSLPDSPGGESILFGGDQSVSMVKTTSDQSSASTIPLSLDAVLVNNRIFEVPEEGKTVLNHKQNLLSFYYSGMDFRNSTQLNYSYFLEGFDNDWVPAGRNTIATYSNLPAGNYTFHVRVSRQDGTVSPEEIAFPFRIKPSPWMSWPAKLLYSLLGLALIGLLLRYYWLYQEAREKALLAEADRALAESEHLIRQPEPKGGSPEEPVEKKLTAKEKDFIEKMERMVEENLSEESFNATVLAEQTGMSYTRFYLKVKELLGMTPQEYLTDRRLTRARELLESGDYNVSEVCYQVGFSSLPGFSRSFKKRFGIPPSEATKAK